MEKIWMLIRKSSCDSTQRKMMTTSEKYERKNLFFRWIHLVENVPIFKFECEHFSFMKSDLWSIILFGIFAFSLSYASEQLLHFSSNQSTAHAKGHQAILHTIINIARLHKENQSQHHYIIQQFFFDWCCCSCHFIPLAVCIEVSKCKTLWFHFYCYQIVASHFSLQSHLVDDSGNLFYIFIFSTIVWCQLINTQRRRTTHPTNININMNMHSTWHATPKHTSSSDLSCDDDDVLLNIILIHSNGGKGR